MRACAGGTKIFVVLSLAVVVAALVLWEVLVDAHELRHPVASAPPVPAVDAPRPAGR